MNTIEAQSVTKLYNLICNWIKDNSVEWNLKSSEFRAIYRLAKLQAASVQILLETPVPLTVEEKVANAIFYVDSDGRYEITAYDSEDKYFFFEDHRGEEYNLKFDEIPTDAYFLGTVRL